MRAIILIILSVVLISPRIFSQPNCQLTYIANEGFLIETGGKKVMVDALFNTISANWCDSPAPEMVQAMRIAAAPFDQVDLIAVTHAHVDHFDASIVIDFLLHSKQAVLLCPEQVSNKLKDNPAWSKVSERVIIQTPPVLQTRSVKAAGIDVSILRLEHSHFMETDSASGIQTNRHRDVENLGYLFDINGLKIFHCGDTNPFNEEEYRTFALNKDSVDLALLERMFFGKGRKGIEVIESYIQPKKIVVMHINPANKAAFADMFRGNPDVVVFEQSLETKNFEFDDK